MPNSTQLELIERWFTPLPTDDSRRHRLAEKVRQNVLAGACKNLLRQREPERFAVEYEVQLCVEQVLLEEWENLTPEERLFIRFPAGRKVGDQVEIPNRGLCTVVRRELTKDFAVDVTFRMSDDRVTQWKFWD